MSAKLQQLDAMLRPVIEGLGFDCWGIDYRAQGKHSVLRVYIDHPDGISVEHCEQVSRQISGVLDVEDPISNNYSLEVSSPGMDCPLFSLAHYQALVGSQIQLKLRMAFEGRRKYLGIINGVQDNDVLLVVDDHELQLPFDSIESAQVVPVFE